MADVASAVLLAAGTAE
jgi:acyl-CoA dehydrogenase